MKALLLSGIIFILVIQNGTLSAQTTCRITVPVIVFVQKPIHKLSVYDFLAKLKGNEISISSIKPPPASRRFVFVLDRSASMATKPAASHELEQSLDGAISTIANTDMVAFVAFAGQYSQQTGFMQQDMARTKIAEEMAWGPRGLNARATPLWDSVDSAVRMLLPRKPGDVIVVVSDGGDDESKLTRDQIQMKLTRAGITMLAMVVTSGPLQTPEERQEPAALTELAEATGGMATILNVSRPDAKATANWQTSPSSLISHLAHQFSLSLEMPFIQKPQNWQLSIKSPEMRKDVRLFYPQTLYPCGSTQ